MTKKFKGKLCVYCAERPSESGDHVFAKEFFLLRDRDNLPKVPACKACNEAKSKLEHYLTSVLPFGGRHKSAKTNLETRVPQRLKKNRKLSKQLAEETLTVWSEERGKLWVQTIAFGVTFGVRS